MFVNRRTGVGYSGYCAMWMKSPCYRCQTEVYPTRILPPLKRNERVSRNTHECSAPDCVGRLRHGHPVQLSSGHRPHYIRGTQQLSCSVDEKVKKRLKLCIALHGKLISDLRGVTCHMGSRSVTCQVSAPRLNPSQTGRYSIYLSRRDGRLSWPS